MAAKRKRNYKAEYERRKARGAALGKTRQQARGHKAKEHVERARRSRSKFGVSPGTLTKLRKQALEHVMAALRGSSKKAPSEATLRTGLRLLHAEDLRAMLDINSADYFKGVAAVQELQLAALAISFPYSIDNIEEAGRNPLWYK